MFAIVVKNLPVCNCNLPQSCVQLLIVRNQSLSWLATLIRESTIAMTFNVLYVIFATISIYRESDGVNTVSITSFNIANNFVRDILDVLKLTVVTPQLCDICKVTKSFILCSGIRLPSLEFAKIYPNFIRHC